MCEIYIFAIMKFHKITYLAFAIFFLATKVGVAFNVHHCGEVIAKVTSVFHDERGCGMEMPVEPKDSCEKEISKKSCCSDEVVSIQNLDENPLADQLHFSPIICVALLQAIQVVYISEENTTENIELPSEVPDTGPPLYQLYCQYTF